MKPFAAVLLAALGVAACAAPIPSVSPGGSPPPTVSPSQAVSPVPVRLASPLVAPPSPGPSANAEFTATCLGSPEPGAASGSPTVLNDCSDLASDVLAAVSHLGYPIQAMTLRTFDFGCGGPFSVAVYSCPPIPAGPRPTPGSGYVTFVGTAKVAALTYRAVDDPPLIVNLVAFEVPPAGWVMP